MEIADALDVSGIFALVVAFVALLNSQWNVRKDYQYERSSNVTRARFAREFEEIDKVSQALGLLIARTKAIKEGGIDVYKHRQWDKAYRQAQDAYASSVLFLKYYDLEACDGNVREFCGVCVNCSKGDDDDDDDDNNNNKECSLYALAGNVIEKCREEEAMISAGEIIVESGTSADDLFDEFLICAICRLRAVETGKRDARRIERRKQLGIGEFSHEYDRYGRSCPLDKDVSKKAGVPKLNESAFPAAMVIIVAVLLPVALLVLLGCVKSLDTTSQGCISGMSGDYKNGESSPSLLPSPLLNLIMVACAAGSYIALYRALFISKVSPSSIEKSVVWITAFLGALLSTAAIVLHQINFEGSKGSGDIEIILSVIGIAFAIAVIVCSIPQLRNKRNERQDSN